jgi:thiol-disulfide isomerase/thioredoxin
MTTPNMFAPPHMRPLLGGLALIAAGVVLLWVVGLPQRAQFIGQVNAEGAWTAAAVGAVAPPLRLPLLEGGTFDLGAMRGQPILLNFWATWCEPCRVEMPLLQSLHAQGTAVIAIHLSEAPSTIRPWLAELELDLPIALDSDGAAAAAYWLRGQPTTVLIGRDGIVRAIFYGPVSLDQLQNALAAGQR